MSSVQEDRLADLGSRVTADRRRAAELAAEAVVLAAEAVVLAAEAVVLAAEAVVLAAEAVVLAAEAVVIVLAHAGRTGLALRLAHGSTAATALA